MRSFTLLYYTASQKPSILETKDHRQLDALTARLKPGFYYYCLRPDFGVTGYSSARIPILEKMYVYTVGRRSQGSDVQWNLSSDANRTVSTCRRSLDGVDSSGDKTTITTIPTVGVYSSSDKTSIATIPDFQVDLLSASALEIRLWIGVNVVESTYD